VDVDEKRRAIELLRRREQAMYTIIFVSLALLAINVLPRLYAIARRKKDVPTVDKDQI
jgi:hypothetical protein